MAGFTGTRLGGFPKLNNLRTQRTGAASFTSGGVAVYAFADTIPLLVRRLHHRNYCGTPRHIRPQIAWVREPELDRDVTKAIADAVLANGLEMVELVAFELEAQPGMLFVPDTVVTVRVGTLEVMASEVETMRQRLAGKGRQTTYEHFLNEHQPIGHYGHHSLRPRQHSRTNY